jgi:hypothetical protein
LADHAFKNSRPKGGTESHPAAQRKWSEFPETCGHIFRNPQMVHFFTQWVNRVNGVVDYGSVEVKSALLL